MLDSGQWSGMGGSCTYPEGVGGRVHGNGDGADAGHSAEERVLTPHLHSHHGNVRVLGCEGVPTCTATTPDIKAPM